MDKISRTLENIGFSPNEIKVYLTLNKHGSQKAGKVAKLAQIDRSSCYMALKSLTEKGLVSYVIIANVKWFQATGPKRLKEYMQDQIKDVEEILPTLHAQHKSAKLEGQVRMFKGVKGVKTIFLDMARTGQNNLVFGSEGQFTDRMPEFSKQFIRRKRENKIGTRLICRKGREANPGPLSEHRYLDVAESPAVTNIYGDKIAIVIWTDEPEGIIIENAAAAKAYRSYFDVLWRVAKPDSARRKL